MTITLPTTARTPGSSLRSGLRLGRPHSDPGLCTVRPVRRGPGLRQVLVPVSWESEDPQTKPSDRTQSLFPTPVLQREDHVGGRGTHRNPISETQESSVQVVRRTDRLAGRG